MIERWRRLGRHLFSGPLDFFQRMWLKQIAWYLLEAVFLLSDGLGLPDLLLALNKIFKPNTRRLNDRERALGHSIFGDSIQYNKVWIDERAHIGCRQYHFAYVGFNAINCWGQLSDAHFIHELVHIWQYQHLGSVYIPRALAAQRSAAGYNYGGISALTMAVEAGESLLDFNFEQQGDIVSDFFCLKNGIMPRWCAADIQFVPVFEAIIEPALNSKPS